MLDSFKFIVILLFVCECKFRISKNTKLNDLNGYSFVPNSITFVLVGST